MAICQGMHFSDLLNYPKYEPYFFFFIFHYSRNKNELLRNIGQVIKWFNWIF